jgi:hypothetical protein
MRQTVLPLALVTLVLLVGCSTSGIPAPQGATATFRDSSTGTVKTCQEESMSTTAALFCIPCGVAAAKTKYADCKSELERAGYQRVDGQPLPEAKSAQPVQQQPAQPGSPVGQPVTQPTPPPVSTTQPQPATLAPVVQVPTVQPDGSALPNPVDRTRARLQRCGANPNSALIREDGSWRIPSYGNDVELREITRCMGGRFN